MSLIPQVQKHQSRLDAEELLDLDATRSDAKAAEPKEAPKEAPKEDIGLGDATFENETAAKLSMLRARRDALEAAGKGELADKIQSEINALVAPNQTTDSNNE